ncbi:hypothetical protein VPNG_09789 [Cytospora leucostoma]|uniref:Protein kinase domain-containing protein n=1 Tax=Cytospora leucostoma TaxID=1230097 RepID=A0A423VGS6_9PEZI|nr:hypothetical protein VPNG_09789 [Cytospora leucostoma]
MSQQASSNDARNTSFRPLVWRAPQEEQASSEIESQASGYSDKTIEFPPGYLETRLAVEKMIKEYDQHTFSINQLDLNNTWPGQSMSCYPSFRILLKHKRGNKAIELIDTESLSLEAPLMEGVADALGNKVELLAIPQRRDSLQCTVIVGDLKCVLIYDPDSDDVFIRNIGGSVLSALPMSKTGAGLVLAMPMKKVVLTATLWEFRSKGDMVEVEILPRQYLLRTEQSTTAIAGSKRSLSSEEEFKQQKKVKGEDGTLLPNSATAPLLGSRPVDLDQPGPILVHKAREEVTATFQLEPWQKLCIVDRRTGNTEYSFTRLSKWESRTQSSEIFRAILRTHAKQQGRVVVVKVIKGDTIANDDNLNSTVAAKWFQEYKLLSTLKHPHIAGLVSCDARIWSLYLEHKDGQDLASPRWCSGEGDDRPHSFKGTINDACHILADMASALAYIGRQGMEGGLMHRNVKPSNIIYRRYNPKVTRFSRVTQYGAALIDFSEAVQGTSHRKDGGTPWYTPPEVFIECSYGKERDVYALGVVMLYLIGCIGLPERTEPEMTTGEQVEAWHTRVEEWRKSLRPRNDHTDTEAELVVIVRTMLRHENRATAEQLEKATRKWASKTAM